MKRLAAALTMAAIGIAFALGTIFWGNELGYDRDVRIERSIEANCEVLSVLLINRANRDETAKLFDPIRRRNPEQWDRLVKRAEAGDRRLARAKEHLAC